MQVSDDPRGGTELAGYRIESLLGFGGMSVVYLAEDLRLKRKVALKLLAECLAAAPGEVDAALERYARVRMGRATELQRSSAKAGNVFYLPDGDEQRRRDEEYATLQARQPFGHRQRLWEYDVRSWLH